MWLFSEANISQAKDFSSVETKENTFGFKRCVKLSIDSKNLPQKH